MSALEILVIFNSIIAPNLRKLALDHMRVLTQYATERHPLYSAADETGA